MNPASASSDDHEHLCRQDGREKGILSSALGAIGNTPLVDLSRLVKARNGDGRILAKLEFLSPGLSKKDRVAYEMIETAERQGQLQQGQTVVELTSGNTGTGLAIVCAIKGYPFVAVMSKGNSMERARMMTALGAEVILVDQCPDSVVGKVSGMDLELVESKTQQVVKERKAFRANQFELESAMLAHYRNTAREIVQQTTESLRGNASTVMEDPPFHVFCDFVGTGGSFGGCTRYFKDHVPEVKSYVVEPEGAAVLAQAQQRAGDSTDICITNPGHKIQGGGYAKTDLTLIDVKLIDGFVTVTEQEAIEMSRDLAKIEGLFVGFSAGANVAAALKLLSRPEHKGQTVVALLCDSGLKYLSTDLWL